MNENGFGEDIALEMESASCSIKGLSAMRVADLIEKTTRVKE